MGLIMKEVSIKDLPVIPTLIWEGVPLFDIADGIGLVEYCEKNDIAVLGMEGFEIRGDQRIPDMDCIVDFSASLSDECFLAKSLAAIKRILSGLPSHSLFLEFVLVKG